MDSVEAPIEDTVELDRNYPRIHERYFTEFYYIPERDTFKENRNKCTNKDTQGPSDIKTSSVEEKQNSEEKGTQQLCELETSSISDGPEEDKDNECDVDIQNLSREDTCVLFHSNKLALITLSHHHPILAHKKEIVKVSFDVGKFNRLENQVTGKSKRGAQMMGPRSPVCIITCSDGKTYTVLAGVNGKLIEVNERLQENPKLLSENPREEGYLAIVLPPLRSGKSHLNWLLSKEQYEDTVSNYKTGLLKNSAETVSTCA